MTSYFYDVEPVARWIGTALFTRSPVAAGEAQTTVGRLAC